MFARLPVHQLDPVPPRAYFACTVQTGGTAMYDDVFVYIAVAAIN